MTAIERAEALLRAIEHYPTSWECKEPNCALCAGGGFAVGELEIMAEDLLRGYIGAVKAFRDLRDMRGALRERQAEQNAATHKRVAVADADFERLFPEAPPSAD